MPQPSEFTVVHDGDRFRVGYCGTLVVGSWHGRALAEDLDVFREGELAALQHCEVLNLIVAVKLQGGGIESDIRAKGEALQREFADRLIGQSVMLVGSGLVAATVRAFASGLNLLSRGRVPTGTCGEPDAALNWLIKLKRQPPEVAAHLQTLHAATAEFTRRLFEP